MPPTTPGYDDPMTDITTSHSIDIEEPPQEPERLADFVFDLVIRNVNEPGREFSDQPLKSQPVVVGGFVRSDPKRTVAKLRRTDWHARPTS